MRVRIQENYYDPDQTKHKYPDIRIQHLTEIRIRISGSKERLRSGSNKLQDDKNIKARSNKRQKSGSNKIRGSKASQGFELRRGSGSRGSKNKEQEYGIRIQQNPKIPKNTRIQCPDQAKKEDQDLAKSKILIACVRVVFFVVKVVHN